MEDKELEKPEAQKKRRYSRNRQSLQDERGERRGAYPGRN